MISTMGCDPNLNLEEYHGMSKYLSMTGSSAAKNAKIGVGSLVAPWELSGGHERLLQREEANSID